MTSASKSEVKHSAHLVEHTITVLLIDDQAMVGEAVRRMLEGERDIDFHFCQEPTQAIKTANELQPTVILQDLVMPDIDGLTLVKFFRANAATRDIPLIVLSTKEEPATKAEAFALGANDYLVKLPDRIELLARIRYHSQAYIALLQRNEVLNKLEAELAEAAEYVKKLLPEPVREGPLRTDWRFVSSTSLGGDALGYHWLDDDHFVLYLLDVTGHGVGAALLSVSVMNVLRSGTLPGVNFREPDQVLFALNKAFPMEEQGGNMFSIWYGVYNTSRHEIVYSTGGHPPALLITTSATGAGELTELRTKGIMIGGFADFPFTKDVYTLTRPGRLYIFSDGVYEVKKQEGKLWMFEEFEEFMTQTPAENESLMDRLYNHVIDLGGSKNLEDDFSILEITFE